MNIESILTTREIWAEFLRALCTRYMILEEGTLFFLAIESYQAYKELIASKEKIIGISRYNNQVVIFLPREFKNLKITGEKRDQSQRLCNLIASGMFEKNFRHWAQRYGSKGLKRTLSLEKKILKVN